MTEEGDIIRNTEVKPRGGMAPFEGGKANGRIYATPGSAEGSGAHLKCLCIDAHSVRTDVMNWKFWSSPRVISPVLVGLAGVSPVAGVLLAVQEGQAGQAGWCWAVCKGEMRLHSTCC